MYICMHADQNNKKGNLGHNFQNSMKMEILGLIFKLDHSMVKSAWGAENSCMLVFGIVFPCGMVCHSMTLGPKAVCVH